MTTPSRPEADMLHMQHAQLASQLVRQQEGARRRARRDVAARRTPAAAPVTEHDAVAVRPAPKVRVYGPRPA